MRNVFGDSSDSEPELAPPPPKKFRPPAEILDAHENAENLNSIGDSPVKPALDFPGNSPLDLENIQHSNSTDLSINDLDDDFEMPRFGLGSRNNLTVFNQKASLNQSIIDENSIGYKIMAKMGYRPGKTIGSSENPNALVEPLPIHAKPARSGIGIATFTPKIASEISTESACSFTDAVKTKHTEKNRKFMIYKLQKFCIQASGEDIGLEQGDISPEEVNPLWKDYVTSTKRANRRTALFGEKAPETRGTSQVDDDSNDIEDAGILEEKLEQLIRYARETFHYCPYCGVCYDDDTDLNDNCPGDTEQEHQV